MKKDQILTREFGLDFSFLPSFRVPWLAAATAHSMGSKQDRPSTHLTGETSPLSGPMAPAELMHQQMVFASSSKSQGCSPPSIMP